jgi:hypothetical protein
MQANVLNVRNGAWIAMCALLSSGCSLYSLTGDVLSNYAVEHLVPHLMTGTDTQVACETGVSLSALLLSFRRVTDDPHKASVASFVAAATCPEFRAFEAELRQLRSLKAGQSLDAQDARIVEKLERGRAAARYHRAYQHLVLAYGEPSDQCPSFDTDNDELLWFLGLTGIISAVQHDRASGGLEGIPMDVPRKVARGIKCLNNSKWWGVPNAVEAAVWVGVPGAAPKGADPWGALEVAAALGDAAGVRIARAVQAQAAATVGKEDLVKTAIEQFAASHQEKPAPAQWALLDQLALRQIQALSDRIWTEKIGHRTPIGQLGSFGDNETAEDAEDADDLLDLDGD